MKLAVSAPDVSEIRGRCVTVTQWSLPIERQDKVHCLVEQGDGLTPSLDDGTPVRVEERALRRKDHPSPTTSNFSPFRRASSLVYAWA